MESIEYDSTKLDPSPEKNDHSPLPMETKLLSLFLSLIRWQMERKREHMLLLPVDLLLRPMANLVVNTQSVILVTDPTKQTNN